MKDMAPKESFVDLNSSKHKTSGSVFLETNKSLYPFFRKKRILSDKRYVLHKRALIVFTEKALLL